MTAAVLIHEGGHLAAARILGIPMRRGRGGAFGIRMSFDFSRSGWGREAAVHLAGPAAGMLTAVLYRSDPAFSVLNAGLAFVNLLPLHGFDGGGVLLCLLLSRTDPARAERLAALVSAAVRGLLWLAAVRLALLPEPDAGLLLFALGELCRSLPPATAGATAGCGIRQKTTGKIR